eukprot:8941326-Alexandrium_andersonii.AAC.1
MQRRVVRGRLPWGVLPDPAGVAGGPFLLAGMIKNVCGARVDMQPQLDSVTSVRVHAHACACVCVRA